MYSKFNLLLLAAVMLAAALPLCIPGAPLEDAPTDLPPDETSGEEEEGNQGTIHLVAAFNITDTWKQVTESTKRHRKEFEDEFRGNVEYNSLDKYKHPSFPVLCIDCNFSKEALLQTLGQDLLLYSVLLKFVDREYHNSSIVTEVNARIPLLIKQIKPKMGNADRVVALTSSQEQQLLKELDSPDPFKRKMTAHCILSFIHGFFVDGIRLSRKYEMFKGQVVHTKGKLVTSKQTSFFKEGIAQGLFSEV